MSISLLRHPHGFALFLLWFGSMFGRPTLLYQHLPSQLRFSPGGLARPPPIGVGK
jgi:hypothetical protein